MKKIKIKKVRIGWLSSAIDIQNLALETKAAGDKVWFCWLHSIRPVPTSPMTYERSGISFDNFLSQFEQTAREAGLVCSLGQDVQVIFYDNEYMMSLKKALFLIYEKDFINPSKFEAVNEFKSRRESREDLLECLSHI